MMKSTRNLWRDEVCRRFAQRECFPLTDAYQRFWIDQNISYDLLDSALSAVELVCGIPPGCFRPDDELDLIFIPPRNLPFFQRVAAEVQAGDAKIELAELLWNRRKTMRLPVRNRPRLLTILEFVREWAGEGSK
jgi:hypothetical protein